MHLNPFLKVWPQTLEVSFGQFICPHCQDKTSYKHKERVERRMILFFVPILGNRIEEYIECQKCLRRFPLDVLRSKLRNDDKQLLENLNKQLRAGASIDHTISMLVGQGMDEATARRYVRVAAGIRIKRCAHCDLTFHGDAVRCNRCATILPTAQV